MPFIEVFDGFKWSRIEFEQLRYGDIVRIFIGPDHLHTIRGERILVIDGITQLDKEEYVDLPKDFEIEKISIIPYSEFENKV